MLLFSVKIPYWVYLYYKTDCQSLNVLLKDTFHTQYDINVIFHSIPMY